MKDKKKRLLILLMISCLIVFCVSCAPKVKSDINETMESTEANPTTAVVEAEKLTAKTVAATGKTEEATATDTTTASPAATKTPANTGVKTATATSALTKTPVAAGVKTVTTATKKPIASAGNTAASTVEPVATATVEPVATAAPTKKPVATPLATKTPAPAQPKPSVTFTGIIIDEDCFVQYENIGDDPGEDTTFCLRMKACAASGYGIAVRQANKAYKFYYFDGQFASFPSWSVGTGTQLTSWNLVNSTAKVDHVTISVTGKLDGTTRVSPYDGKRYPVITVSKLFAK